MGIYKELIFLTIIAAGIGGCVTQPTETRIAQPTVIFPTPSVVPSPTFTITKTPSPSSTQTQIPSLTSKPPTFTPTETPKPILISRSTTGGDGADEEYLCLRWRYPFRELVIYEDGQLIIYTKDGLRETYLSQDEIQGLLSHLEQTGIFEERESVYVDPPMDHGEGGPSDVLQIKGTPMWINPALWEYVDQSVKDSLALIDAYRPSDTQPYNVQKLWLMIVDVTDLNDFQPYATPIPPVETWPGEISSLEGESMVVFQVVSGNKAEGILGLFDKLPSSRIFNQNDRFYYVVACPVLP